MLRWASGLAAAVGAVGFLPDARAIQFNISSIPELPLHIIPGGAFSFGGFKIDSVVGGTGSAVGYVGGIGSLAPWDFKFGSASTVSGPIPLIETAPMFPASGFTIFGIVDGRGGHAGAMLSLPAGATSLYTPIASFTDLRIEGVLPIEEGEPFGLRTSDPDLVEFFTGNEFVLTFSFSLVPGRTLADLIENGGSTAYSGVLYSRIPDSGTTMVLMGIGLWGLMMARRRLAK